MSKWREKYKVHPAADVFPMMSDEELAALGEDIKKNGLASLPVRDYSSGLLLDGRNRFEAMERAGLDFSGVKFCTEADDEVDPVKFIISLNIHRRHLTKQQQADLIVAAHMAAE